MTTVCAPCAYGHPMLPANLSEEKEGLTIDRNGWRSSTRLRHLDGSRYPDLAMHITLIVLEDDIPSGGIYKRQP